MHAEGVKVGLRPSQLGLKHDACKVLSCEECHAQYQLYYDSDAEGSFTYWSLLAQEIITARHPQHTDNVALDLVEKF